MKKQELLSLVKEKLAANGAVNVPLILAASGGPDSMSLLDLVRQALFTVNIRVVHINHGLRKSALQDQKVVERYCLKHGLNLVVKEADVKGAKIRLKGSTEERARDLRYKILRKEAARNKAAYILVAHTADDQVETILFNLIRGASLRGLGGMKERTGEVLRPLLSVSKKDLLAYTKANKLEYAIDESNATIDYTRNFIRHKLVPILAKINPQVSTQLWQTAQTVQGAERAVRDLARLHIAAMGTVAEKEIIFSVSKLLELTQFMRAEVIKATAELLGILDIEWSAAQLAQLDLVISSGSTGIGRRVGGKLLVQKRYDKISISLI